MYLPTVFNIYGTNTKPVLPIFIVYYLTYWNLSSNNHWTFKSKNEWMVITYVPMYHILWWIIRFCFQWKRSMFKRIDLQLLTYVCLMGVFKVCNFSSLQQWRCRYWHFLIYRYLVNAAAANICFLPLKLSVILNYLILFVIHTPYTCKIK